jgi:protein disulfide-isomerase A6
MLHLDTLAATFYSSPAASRPEILKRAQAYVAELTGEANKTASYYVKAMEKVLDQGESWLAKETARWVVSSAPSFSVELAS